MPMLNRTARRVRDLGPDPDSAAIDAVARRIASKPARRTAFVTGLAERYAQEPSLNELRVAERVLEGKGERKVLTQMYDTLHEAKPHLLYPLMPRLKFLLTKDQPRALRTQLDAALATTDTTAVDLDPVIEAGIKLTTSEELRRAVAFVGRQPGARAVDTVLARVPALLAALDADDWTTPVEAWIRTPEDLTVCFAVAVTLRQDAAIRHLAPRVDRAGLSDRHLIRAADILWRAPNGAIALDFARAIRRADSAAGRTAQLILGEAESLSMLTSGWAPPAGRAEPAHPVRSRSVFHVLQNSLPHRTTGAANRTHGLLSGIATAGYEVNAVTPPGFPLDDVPRDQRDTIEATQQLGDVTYHHLIETDAVLPRFPVMPFIDAYSEAIFELASDAGAALIHAASNSHNALSGIVAARRLGLPSIYEVRGLYEESRLSRHSSYGSTPQYELAVHMERMATTEADHVIAITQGLKSIIVDRGIPAEKVSVIQNGVDTDRFQPLVRDEKLARHYGLTDKLVIGYVGSFNWYEGHRMLFEVVGRLHRRHPEVRLLMVGGGGENEPLLRLRSRLGLEEVILMPGKVPFEQVEAHYSLIDIAPITRLSSLVTETVSPLKPFEAMAMARTVVSSDVAVMTEIIEHEKTGLLYTKDDPDALDAALERLVVDAALREKLGAQAREWVVAERDWRILGQRVTDIYRSLGIG